MTSCLSCATGKYLYQDLCIQSCPDNTYQNATALQCQSCQDNCFLCPNTSSYCSSCDASLLNFNGSCQMTCPAGYYANASNYCVQCPVACATCSLAGSVPTCLTCAAGYLMLGNTCTACTSPCLYCSGVLTNCTSCITS